MNVNPSGQSRSIAISNRNSANQVLRLSPVSVAAFSQLEDALFPRGPEIKE